MDPHLSSGGWWLVSFWLVVGCLLKPRRLDHLNLSLELVKDSPFDSHPRNIAENTPCIQTGSSRRRRSGAPRCNKLYHLYLGTYMYHALAQPVDQYLGAYNKWKSLWKITNPKTPVSYTRNSPFPLGDFWRLRQGSASRKRLRFNRSVCYSLNLPRNGDFFTRILP